MSYHFSIDLNARRVTITCSEDAGINDVLAAIERTVADDYFGPGFGILVDLRDTKFVPSTEQARHIAAHISDKVFSRNPAALVVSGMVQFAKGTMIAGLVGRNGLSIQPFYDLDKALEWLRGHQAGALH